MQRRSVAKFILFAAVACCIGAPTLSHAREAVAMVLGRTVYRDELGAAPKGLSGRVLEPLLRRFAAEQGLAATRAEVDELMAVLMSAPGRPPIERLSREERAELRKIPEGMVLNWKISRALYRRYGGEVIFQQFNPLEPVGAMRQFLEEQEARKAFVIYNAEDRDRFYEYYRREHPFVLPASSVDFDKPWWRK